MQANSCSACCLREHPDSHPLLFKCPHHSGSRGWFRQVPTPWNLHLNSSPNQCMPEPSYLRSIRLPKGPLSLVSGALGKIMMEMLSTTLPMKEELANDCRRPQLFIVRGSLRCHTDLKVSLSLSNTHVRACTHIHTAYAHTNVCNPCQTNTAELLKIHMIVFMSQMTGIEITVSPGADVSISAPVWLL